ncbi:MAG: hypothetical protein P1U56_17260 [Saprospiraceae bacterium]|nr:hypothetical protein [Saprospiraceae bacterium]
MDPFNGNNRLQDNVMYALDWAIFLRHNISDALIPFLFEWKGEEIYKNMLQPGGDPEEFAYRLAKKSDRNGDQFVVGYEGMLADENEQKKDAFIIKGYDRTQPNGVFLAQLFIPKEKGGTFLLIDKPMLIGTPELPFAIDPDIPKNYQSDDVYFNGMVLNNGDQVGIFSHPNPSVVANGIKRYLRSKVSDEKSKQLSGKFELSVAPNESGGTFYNYTLKRTVEEELENPALKMWENRNNKKISITCKYGDEIVFPESTESNDSSTQSEENLSASNAKTEDQLLVEKYSPWDKSQLDAEFFRLVSIPNARTNIDCLKQMSALIQVYESNGWATPNTKNQRTPQKAKSGCASIILWIIVIGIGSLMA